MFIKKNPETLSEICDAMVWEGALYAIPRFIGVVVLTLAWIEFLLWVQK